MARPSYVQMARSLAGLASAFPICATVQRSQVQCDEKPTNRPKFMTARCTRNEAHTADTRLISFALPSTWQPRGPVVNVLVRTTITSPSAVKAESGCPKQETPPTSTIARPYNPLLADVCDSITLLVKRYDNSKMGAKLHSLKAGETVELLGPKEQITIETGKYSHYGMVAGGTGITPLIQAAEHILHNDSASVTMVTFNKSSQDVLLRKRLAHLEVKHPDRFKVVHVVESASVVTDLEGIATSDELLRELLPPPGPGVLIMVCGKKEMTAAIAGPKTLDFKQGDVGGILKRLGFWTQQVWKL